jgi:hypothetical protein
MPLFSKNNQINLLDKVPCILLANYSEKEDRIILHIPKFKNPILLKWLVPQHKSGVINIKLDSKGSKIWKYMDGERSIQQICDILRETELPGEQLHDLEERTAKFITELYKSRFIKFKEEQL